MSVNKIKKNSKKRKVYFSAFSSESKLKFLSFQIDTFRQKCKCNKIQFHFECFKLQ